MKNVVIYGNSQTAQLANYYLTKEGKFNVIAFTVEKKYLKEATFSGKEVVPYETVENKFPPSSFLLFAPITALNMNKFREKIFESGKSRGYSFCSYVSPNATILTDNIGENCFILENNTIQPYVKIGDNCILWSGNHIGHHSIISQNVFFTSQVVLSGNCKVGNNCFLGVNSSIIDNCTLSEGTFLAMGSSLQLKKTDPWSVYSGHPAKIRPRIKSTRLI